ncbi:ATP-binding protein, partial [Acinetobacter baumannii]
DLAAFLAEAVETHRELAAARGIALTAGTGPASSPLPQLDPSQMQRALDNLIINAIQTTPAGGTIHADARRRDGSLLLQVSDTGPG